MHDSYSLTKTKSFQWKQLRIIMRDFNKSIKPSAEVVAQEKFDRVANIVFNILGVISGIAIIVLCTRALFGGL